MQTIPETFAAVRSEQSRRYDTAAEALGAVLRRMVGRIQKERAEFNPGAFPPEWKVARWKADEALIRQVAALVDEADAVISFERRAYDACLQRVRLLTEATNADTGALLDATVYLRAALARAEAEEQAAWRHVADSSGELLLSQARCIGLMKQLHAAGLTPNLIHSTGADAPTAPDAQ